jgi:hypothetical protein
MSESDSRSSGQPEPIPASEDKPTPTAQDIQQWQQFANSAPERLKNAVSVWRTGYVLLITALGALSVAAASLVVENSISITWRLILTVLLGLALLLGGIALWSAMSAEVRLKTENVNLGKIIRKHLSFQNYLVAEATAGMLRLQRSRKWAVAAALLGFLAVLVLFWLHVCP